MARISDLRAGLDILAKYMDPENHIGGADHDIIYVLPPGNCVVGLDDIGTLKSLGWHYSAEYGWALFT